MTDAPAKPIVRKVHTSLQRQMARPGGRLIAEAESRANQALEGQRDQVFSLLKSNIDIVEGLCASRPADAQAQVYACASAMVDMAGFLDVPTFFEAAFSLCEIADRMRAAGVWSLALRRGPRSRPAPHPGRRRPGHAGIQTPAGRLARPDCPRAPGRLTAWLFAAEQA